MAWQKDVIAQILLTSARNSLNDWHTMKVFEKTSGKAKEAFTNIDVSVERGLATALAEHIPDANFMGEESIATLPNTQGGSIPGGFFAGKAFIVDPIDGTLNYINQLPAWGISLSYVQGNEFTEGAIVLPVLGEMLISENGKLYSYKADMPLSQVDTLELREFTERKPVHDLLACSASEHCFNRYVSKIRVKCQIIGSCVFSIAKVITGSYFAYIAQINIWDYAGGIGIFRALRKPVYYFDGSSVHELPWHIGKHWSQGIKAVYPLIFAHSYEDACRTVLPD